MTINELRYIRKVLVRIVPHDEQVKLAIVYVDKDLAVYESRKGQLKERYEMDNRDY